MLAKRVAEMPTGGGWLFEPKWGGFRALVFRDGEDILIQSRDEKPLNRYFPELLEPLQSQLPGRCVLDGEIVIVKNAGRDRRSAWGADVARGSPGSRSRQPGRIIDDNLFRRAA